MGADLYGLIVRPVTAWEG